MSSSVSFSLDEVISRVRAVLDSDTLVSLVLSDPVERGPATISRMSVRPVLLRQQLVYQVAFRIEKQEYHENLDAERLLERLPQSFGIVFRSLQLDSTTESVEVRWKSAEQIRATIRPARQPAVSKSHNRPKEHLIPEGTPCDFLHALGVMNASGKVLHAKQDKFRQINRFLEMVNDVYASLPADEPLNVADFGCGLSYLTFAVHYLLTAVHRRTVRIVGVDRNPEVIARCQRTATELGIAHSSLAFTFGDIADASQFPMQPLHLAISLHACDTATDAALAIAVKHQAHVILAAPCCQHELARQLHVPALEALTTHGILHERLAALATDALRGAALEAAGYRTQIIEFIDTEHTPKNLLIRAIRRTDASSETDRRRQLRQRYEDLKSTLGVKQPAVDSILSSNSQST